MPSLTRPSVSSAPTDSKDVSLSSTDRVPLSRYAVFFFLAAAGCAADLLTKRFIFQWRGFPGQSPEWWLWKPYVGIETAVNTGAVFGVASGNGRLFAILSIAAALGIVYWLFVRRAATDWFLTATLGAITGGIFGNLHDRLGLWYEPGLPEAWRHGVRDWILFRYGDFTWPNFNIADSLLVCGAALLIWYAHGSQAPQPTAARESFPSTVKGNS